jgi:hypothetical protein
MRAQTHSSNQQTPNAKLLLIFQVTPLLEIKWNGIKLINRLTITYESRTYTEWSKSNATHKSIIRENFTIMLVVILIDYCMLVQLFSPHSPQVLARPWLHPVHPQSNENVICDKMFFFRKINVFLFLNIIFPLGHMQNVRKRLEILSQTL